MSCGTISNVAAVAVPASASNSAPAMNGFLMAFAS